MSYVWGPPISAYHVLVDGQRLQIRENLFHFLHEFCHVPEHEYIWIDQISINQTDIQERGKQVPLMADIYRQASFVVIWLGKDERLIPVALRINATTKSNNKTRAEALSLFLENRYWTRLWIVQEILLAKEVRIMVRPGLWTTGAALQEYFKNFKYFISKDPALYERHHRTLSLIRMIGDETTWRFGYYLTKYSHLDCEDPLDKVYGLLGLIKNRKLLTVDCTKSVSDVFGEVMKVVCLERTGPVHESKWEFATILHGLAKTLGVGYVSVSTFEEMFSDVMAASKFIDLEVVKWTMGFEPARLPNRECDPAIQVMAHPMHTLWWEMSGVKHIHFSRTSYS